MAEMSREEAIDYLKWVRPQKPYTQDKKNLQVAIDMGIEALNEQRPHGEWIPCSERLPDKKGKYLCATHYAIPPYHVFHPEFDTYVDDISVHNFDGNFIDSVVAWMPLPEPYTEEGDLE